MKISEIMERNVVTISDKAPLAEAVKQFWEHDIGFLPVVNEKGEPAGVLTDRDVCMCAWFEGKALWDIPVSKAMSPKVISVAPGDEVGEVENRLAQNQVHRVPVIDKGAIVGVVSLNDIARHAAASFDSNLEEEVTLTLGAIAQPRMIH